MVEPQLPNAGGALRSQSSIAGRTQRTASPKHALCVLPRKRRTNPFEALLPAYQLTTADTFVKISRFARQQSFDLYLIHSPLGWVEATAVCRKFCELDAHTPLVVYSIVPDVHERKDVLAAGARAYVARSDDVHNLPGVAGQLIMLAELRSIDAMSARGAAIQQKLVHQLEELNKCPSENGQTRQARSTERLKLEARKLFAQAGGTRANFERLWPSMYERALKQIER